MGFPEQKPALSGPEIKLIQTLGTNRTAACFTEAAETPEVSYSPFKTEIAYPKSVIAKAIATPKRLEVAHQIR